MIINSSLKGRKMHFSVKFMRWVFGAVYLLLLLVFLCISLFASHGGMVLLGSLVAIVVTQVIFLLGTGTINFCKPLKKRRLFIPVLTAALLATVLTLGACFALDELLKLKSFNFPVFFAIIIVSWVFWAIAFFFYTHKSNRFQVLYRLTAAIFAGSWLQLLVTIPSHVVVSRRPGCFLGIQTAAGIAAGLAVMFWAFGPGIILLFLNEKRKAELNGKKINFTPGFRKTVFCTSAIVILLISFYLAANYLTFSEISERKMLLGYALSMVAFLIALVGLVITIRRKVLDISLIALSYGLIVPGLLVMALSSKFVDNLQKAFKDSPIAAIVENPALVICLLITGLFLVVVSFKNKDNKQIPGFLIQFVFFVVASIGLGLSFENFMLEKAAQKAEEQSSRQKTDIQKPDKEHKHDSPSLNEISVGKPFPELEFEDLKGNTVNISKLKGKVVLIGFWATWCGPCLGETPHLLSVYEEFKDKGLEIIGISLDSDRQKLENYLETNQITWPNYFDGKSWSNEISTRFGVHGIPTILLIDREGIVRNTRIRGNDIREAVAGLCGIDFKKQASHPINPKDWKEEYTVELEAVDDITTRKFGVNWFRPHKVEKVVTEKADFITSLPTFKYDMQRYLTLRLGDAENNQITAVVDFRKPDRKYFPFDLYLDKGRDGDLAEDFIEDSTHFAGVQIPYSDGTTESYSLHLYSYSNDGSLGFAYQSHAGRYGSFDVGDIQVQLLMIDNNGNGIFNDSEDVILMDWDFDGKIDGSHQSNEEVPLYSLLKFPGASYRVVEFDPPGRRMVLKRISIDTDSLSDDIQRDPSVKAIEEDMKENQISSDKLLEIIETKPALPSKLNIGEKLTIKFHYDLGPADQVQIWARPYTNGRRTGGYGAHGSPVYNKRTQKTGEAEGWFLFDVPTVVDEVRIEMKDVKSDKTIYTLSKRIDAKWIAKSIEQNDNITKVSSKSYHEDEEADTSLRKYFLSLTRAGLLKISTSGSHEVLVPSEGKLRGFEVLNHRVYVANDSSVIIFDQDGTEQDRINISSDIYFLDFTALEDGRLALLDNQKDEVYFINHEGLLLHTAQVSEINDGHWQNMHGVQVGNELIVSEDGNSRIVSINLTTYEVAVFKDLSKSERRFGSLGSIVYANGRFYLCQSQQIYSFTEETEPVHLASLPEGNITGIEIEGEWAYLPVNFSGKLYKVNLKTGDYQVLAKDLNYPRDIEIVYETKQADSDKKDRKDECIVELKAIDDIQHDSSVKAIVEKTKKELSTSKQYIGHGALVYQIRSADGLLRQARTEFHWTGLGRGGYMPQTVAEGEAKVMFDRDGQPAELRVIHPEYHEFHRPITFEKGKTVVWDDIVLERVSASSSCIVKGSVHLEDDANPADIHVYGDGRSETTTNEEGEFILSNLRSGEINIFANKSGYNGIYTSVSVDKGETATCKLNGYRIRKAKVRWVFQPDGSRNFSKDNIVTGTAVLQDDALDRVSFSEGFKQVRGESDFFIYQKEDSILIKNFDVRMDGPAFLEIDSSFDELIEVPDFDYNGLTLTLKQGKVYVFRTYDGEKYAKMEVLEIID